LVGRLGNVALSSAIPKNKIKLMCPATPEASLYAAPRPLATLLRMREDSIHKKGTYGH
jgi:hypothetical protein